MLRPTPYNLGYATGMLAGARELILMRRSMRRMWREVLVDPNTTDSCRAHAVTRIAQESRSIRYFARRACRAARILRAA